MRRAQYTCITFINLLPLLLLFLTSSQQVAMASRQLSVLRRPLGLRVDNYVRLKPEEMEQKRPQVDVVLGGREVKSCMPKGIRRSSAPSRKVNYLPMWWCSATSSASHSGKP